MKFGFVLPSGDARTSAEFAGYAEHAGWDGFFVWEPVWGIDAWVCLTAAAMVTEHIRLGTLLSPISRMRPWKLASETATLDNLSNGRVILSVGLGAINTGFAEFGEETDRRTRAKLMDEGLEILTGLWGGQPYSYEGKHYTVQDMDNSPLPPPPPPVQKPRIPIWVVGAWPRMKSMRRVLRYDGLLPVMMDETGKFVNFTPHDLRAMVDFISTNCVGSTPFDIIVEGETPGDDPDKARETINPWSEAGATWWIETRWEAPRNAEGLESCAATHSKRSAKVMSRIAPLSASLVYPSADLLQNQIDFSKVPFSDRGSRLMVFTNDDQNHFNIRLAERLTNIEPDIEAYLHRPPLIQFLCFIDEGGKTLEYEANTYPYALYFSTSLGDFGITFVEDNKLAIGLPAEKICGIRFKVSPQFWKMNEQGGEFRSIRNLAYATNGEIKSNEIIPEEGGYIVQLIVQTNEEITPSSSISPIPWKPVMKCPRSHPCVRQLKGDGGIGSVVFRR